MTTLTLSIAAVERDTGLSKDTLRVWERRYGFPAPLRAGVSERAYPLDQVDKLRLIKRLLDAGHRPGRVVAMDVDALRRLADATGDAGDSESAAQRQPAVAEIAARLALIRAHDLTGLRRRLARDLGRVGLQRFIDEVLVPLNEAVGDAWLRGQLQVFEEHAYAELVQALLRQAIAAIPPAPAAARPRVLLATLPGEPHGLALLMAEGVLALEGCACVSLGLQCPAWDLVLGARAFGSDIVALSVSGCGAPNATVGALTELRAKLPPATALWAGGSAPVLQRRRIDGVLPLDAIGRLAPALQAWRRAHAIDAA